jgi:hypothetical protein
MAHKRGTAALPGVQMNACSTVATGDARSGEYEMIIIPETQRGVDEEVKLATNEARRQKWRKQNSLACG